MAGIYIHIPFCRSACSYCDFHFNIQLKYKSKLVEAIIEEARQRAAFLGDEEVQSIYFGGGTPSVLEKDELNAILRTIMQEYRLSGNAEITFEANPDDLNASYLKDLVDSGINRLSIGIQSWDDKDLIKMNRRHNSLQAEKCLHDSIKAGISNLSIDLIYGLPGMNSLKWRKNLKKSFSFEIKHLSAYHLTYEPGTILYYKVKKKSILPINEEESAKQYFLLLDESERHGYHQYEISNFALNGFNSKHNSGYWNGTTYLGLGPSAHSYDRKKRYWNISNNKKYSEGILSGKIVYESEILGEIERFNEYIMTSLRTINGCNLLHISKNFNKAYNNNFLKIITPYIAKGLALKEGERIKLTKQGMLLSDRIIADLMII